MIEIGEIVSSAFDVPRLFFTVGENSGSATVVLALSKCMKGNGVVCRIFNNPDEARQLLGSDGFSPHTAVAFFDCKMRRGKRFSPTVPTRPTEAGKIPDWAQRIQWVMKVNPDMATASSERIDSCARQLRSFFSDRSPRAVKRAEEATRGIARNPNEFPALFREKLDGGWFPWGPGRKGEKPPCNIALSGNVNEVLERLNRNGPNLAAAIADSGHAAELPTGSIISWLRVPAKPVVCDESYVRRVHEALAGFEGASMDLLAEKPNEIKPLLLAGVDFPLDEGGLADCYLSPHVRRFSVRRPDLHWTKGCTFASESDEMPGGFAELAHLDNAYGVNQDRWKRCFEWLTSRGLLLFVVSHRWSRVYVPELEWLTSFMKSKGYPVSLATTDNLESLAIRDNGVFWESERVGTVWRQFPIFEAEGVVADLVRAAADSKVVRMVPEFACLGNKTWYAIFRRYADYFRGKLESSTFGFLEGLLPDSHLVLPSQLSGSFPCRVADNYIEELDNLRELPERVRDGLVLKVAGANTQSARSYGVLMGKGLSSATWQGWVNERLQKNQPFIIQERIETAVAHLPVLHTGLKRPELFPCRVLVRPWMVGDEVVSAHGCAVPSDTLRVHGRVDMAVFPVQFK